MLTHHLSEWNGSEILFIGGELVTICGLEIGMKLNLKSSSKYRKVSTNGQFFFFIVKIRLITFKFQIKFNESTDQLVAFPPFCVSIIRFNELFSLYLDGWKHFCPITCRYSYFGCVCSFLSFLTRAEVVCTRYTTKVTQTSSKHAVQLHLSNKHCSLTLLSA